MLWNRFPGLALALLSAGLTCLIPADARTATIDVNDFSDAVDANLDEHCATAAGTCTLRAAVQTLGRLPGPVREVRLPAGHYVLTLPLPTTTGGTNRGGALDTTFVTRIVGLAGSALTTIEQTVADRVITKLGGDDLEIIGVTITGGRQPSSYYPGGGGILADRAALRLTDVVVTDNQCVGDGGAIKGTDVTLTNVRVTGNRALQAPDGRRDGGFGGGIMATRRLQASQLVVSGNRAAVGGGVYYRGASRDFRIERSLISGNVAEGFFSADGVRQEWGEGAGIAANFFTGPPGTAAPGRIDTTTLRGNDVLGSGGNLAHIVEDPLEVRRSLFSNSITMFEGGGVSTHGRLTVENSTIAANTGGGLAFVTDEEHSGYGITLRNVTIARNSSGVFSNLPVSRILASGVIFDNDPATQNCRLPAGSRGIELRGTNLDSGTSCRLSAFELSSTNPLLGPLADNGGPTFTFALQAGSPAIDAFYGRCPSNDQRLAPRPSGVQCDIGAFEYGATPISAFLLPPPDLAEVIRGFLSLSLDARVAQRLAAEGITIDVGPKGKPAGRVSVANGYMGRRLMHAGLAGDFVFRREQSAVATGPGILIGERGQGRLFTKLGDRHVLALFDLTKLEWQGGKGGATVRLTKHAAQRLNALLKTRAFVAGLPFGTIAIDATLAGDPQLPKLVDGGGTK
jgi:predicted outer membrane repeat protein